MHQTITRSKYTVVISRGWDDGWLFSLSISVFSNFHVEFRREGGKHRGGRRKGKAKQPEKALLPPCSLLDASPSVRNSQERGGGVGSLACHWHPVWVFALPLTSLYHSFLPCQMEKSHRPRWGSGCCGDQKVCHAWKGSWNSKGLYKAWMV